MEWNLTTVGAACLAVGTIGFVVGKISGGDSPPAGKLPEYAGKAAGERMTGIRDGDDAKAAARTGRSEQSRDASLEDRLAKMEAIILGENALDRGRAILAWISSLAPGEFEAAVDHFRNLGMTGERSGEYAMLLTAWAELDPTAALTYTEENTTGGMATGTVLGAWASRDPEAALAWARANHAGEDANPYMVGIIRGLAGIDPARATALLLEMPFSRERGEALSAMIPHLMESGTEAAKDWIGQLGDEKLRDGAKARLAEVLAKKDPEGSAKWLMEDLGDASVRAVDDVYGEWARRDKTAALASFNELPKGDGRTRALRGLVIAGARENPAEAADLMNRFPEDLDDSTVQHFIWNSFDVSPEVAVSQISLIGKGDRQNRMYARALDAWLERDAVAARKWINSADLPSNVLKGLADRNQP